MNKTGMLRVASVAPTIRIANPEYNSKEIIKFIKEAKKKNIGLTVFPALCLTGASCGDLFFQESLYRGQLKALEEILKESEAFDGCFVLGMYLKTQGRLISCGALIQAGEICGLVPFKLNPQALDGKQRFTYPKKMAASVNLFGEEIPFGSLVFHDEENEITLALEGGYDLANREALIVALPALSRELITSSGTRRDSTKVKSYENVNARIYASAGAGESSSGGVYSGHLLISESGEILAEDSNLTLKEKNLITEIDFLSLNYKRSSSNFSYKSKSVKVSIDGLPLVETGSGLVRKYSPTPFVPEDQSQAAANCREAFAIQATALARRLLHTGSAKAVLGVSGGLDSTMALLVTARAMEILGKPNKDIIGITMPGFGTTGKTYDNAMTMMEALDVEIREISIKDAVLLHFKDIGHDPEIKNVVYENVQARERTQILMDIANMENGIQIGTGDLSEAALGWSTYNGDHMSMYCVNAGIPKTFMRREIQWYIDEVLSDGKNPDLAASLGRVLNTPVSPELLPPDEKGQIAQMTEDTLGPYILHDFFLYHTVRRGTPPSMLLALAESTFKGQFDENTIKKWLEVFYKRFFIHQFKRSCVPDSPKVGSVSLFSRSDWLMASDADFSHWLHSL